MNGSGGCLNLVTGFVTAPSTTLTAWTMAAGDSLTVKNAPKPAYLIGAWADNQGAGDLRITSPRIHDAVQGIRLGVVASEVYPLMLAPQSQVLIPQDNLTVEQSGSATAGDIESGSLLIYYPSLPGSDGRGITYAQLMARLINIMTTQVTLALGTAGGYSGGVAINSTFDLFKANTDYAILGYLVSAECCSIGIRGPDTGNVRCGGPGNDFNKDLTRNWFVNLARATGHPLIPQFNSANKTSTLVDGVQDENGTDVVVTLICAQLR